MKARLARWFVGIVGIGSIALAIGGYRNPWLWAYIAVVATVSGYAIASIDDDLARERFTPPEPGADRLSLRAVRLIALAHILVGLLDNRFGWSSVPDALRLTGLVAFGLSFLAIVQAMRANRFFSAVVRIQKERGHLVVDRGPYRFLRHPGYAGMIIGIPMGGLALGSWPAVAVALVYSALILRRVAFEDRFLHQHLPGYAAYAERVRFRLVPLLW